MTVLIEEAPIRLVEGDEPLMVFVLTTVDPNNSRKRIPYPLEGKDLRFVVRNVKTESELAEYLSTGVSPGIVKLDENRISVQITSAATDTPGVFRYYLQVVLNGRPRTIRKGDWEIENQ